MSRVVTDSFFEFYLYSNLTYVVELYLESYRKVYAESLLNPLLESLALFLMKHLNKRRDSDGGLLHAKSSKRPIGNSASWRPLDSLELHIGQEMSTLNFT